jgi:hypothetical protein
LSGADASESGIDDVETSHGVLRREDARRNRADAVIVEEVQRPAGEKACFDPAYLRRSRWAFSTIPSSLKGSIVATTLAAGSRRQSRSSPTEEDVI